MDSSRALICLEPELRRRIRLSLRLIGLKEKFLSERLDEYVTLEVSLEKFYAEEYLPKLGPRGGESPAEPAAAPRKPEAAAVKPPPPDAELKALYRDLAKRYHPDVAGGPEEREFFMARMMEINEAFDRGDLRRLAHYGRLASFETGSGCSAERLRELSAEAWVIDELIGRYDKRISGLKDSAFYRLMGEVRRRAQQGADYLAELAATRWPPPFEKA